MKRKLKSTHGAISVFLSIILVPCIAFTVLFVDLSRVLLAKGLTEASGDLALNSLLAHYDADLNEFYGMVTSCQNIDEFYEGSIEYFTRLLKSQGLSGDETKTLLAQASALFDDAEVVDMLQIEVNEDTPPVITAVPEANFANPTIVKDQIVDFMKYRAPINITAGFLKDLGGMVDKLKDTEKDKKLAEEKQQFYEAENELMEKAYEIYVKLKAYQDLDPMHDDTKTKAEFAVDNLNSYRAQYEKIHFAIAKDLFNTDGIKEIRKDTFVLTDYEKKTYSADTPVTAITLKMIMLELAQKITAFIEAREDFKTNVPAWDDSYYPIQYWAQNYKLISGKAEKVNKAQKELMEIYGKFDNAHSFLEDPSVNDEELLINDNYATQYENYSATRKYKISEHASVLRTQFNKLFINYLKAPASSSSSDVFMQKFGKIQEISTNAVNLQLIDPNKNMIDGKSVNATIMDIYNTINSDMAQMEALKDALDGVTKDLDDLKDLITKMKEEFAQWENAANSSDTEMADVDKEEVKDIKEGNVEKGKEIKLDEISEESVDELKTRIGNMEELYQEIIDAFEEVKYGDTELTDIADIADAKDASGIKADDIPMDKATLYENDDSYADTTFEFTPPEGQVVSITITDDNHPNLEHDPKPSLWVWLRENFDVVDDKDKETGEEKYDEYKEEGDSEKKADETKAEGLDPNKNIPADAGDPFGVDDAFGGIIDIAQSFASGGVEGGIVQMRDALYATEYVTNMFSFYTYEKDGKYRLADEDDGTIDGKYNGNLIDVEMMKNTIVSEFDKKFEKSSSGKWEVLKPVEAYNYSLTTKPINKYNYYAYGAEWEYILYGEGTSQGNVNKALTQIYILRFLLNTPYAFTTFWSEFGSTTGKAVNAIASAISAATSGIIPQPLIKVILILMLIALESANDLIMLVNGLPVKVLKIKEGKEEDKEWVVDLNYSGSGMDTKNKNKSSTGFDGFHMSYRDYLYVFLLIGFNNSGFSVKMYNRTANVIQANLNYLISGDGTGNNWDKTKAIIYFNIDATIRAKPLMLELPIAANYSENPKDSTGWNTFSYKTSRGYS